MINLTVPYQEEPTAKPQIVVVGVGGAGGNAVNNMIVDNLQGVDFIVANTDAQALATAKTSRRIQLGETVTQGLGAGAKPDIGARAAEESMDRIAEEIRGANMVFITAGMGGGTGTGAAPIVARVARELGILTVGVVTKPFQFEGGQRMRMADLGIEQLSQYVDTLIVIPNQNLFRVANERTTFADAFKMADNVLHQGVRSITDLMIMPGLINLDFADVRTMMTDMGRAMMGTGEATGERRALDAAEAAIANPLLEDTSMKGAKGVLINITGGMDITLFEVDEAANRIRDEVESDAHIIFGSCFDPNSEGKMRVSVVATGIVGASSLIRTDGRPLTPPPGGGLRSPESLRPNLTTQGFAQSPANPSVAVSRPTSLAAPQLTNPATPQVTNQAAPHPMTVAVPQGSGTIPPRAAPTAYAPVIPARPATNPNAMTPVTEDSQTLGHDTSILSRLAAAVPERADLELAHNFMETTPAYHPATNPLASAPPTLPLGTERQSRLNVDAAQPAPRPSTDAFIPPAAVEHYSQPTLSAALMNAQRSTPNPPRSATPVETHALRASPASGHSQGLNQQGLNQQGLHQQGAAQQPPRSAAAPMRGEPRLVANNPSSALAGQAGSGLRAPVSNQPQPAASKGSLFSRFSNMLNGHPPVESLAERPRQRLAEPMAADHRSQDYNVSIANAPLQRHEEDELEIPTFLRRQAN